MVGTVVASAEVVIGGRVDVTGTDDVAGSAVEQGACINIPGQNSGSVCGTGVSHK